MELDITCTPTGIGTQKNLQIKISQSPYRCKRLTEAFNEAVKTIKFCRLVSVSSAHKGRKRYEIVATVTHPFNFPIGNFEKNYQLILSGKYFYDRTKYFETIEHAKSFTHQVDVLLTDYEVKTLLLNNAVSIRYCCDRQKHKHIKKIIKEIIERIECYGPMWIYDNLNSWIGGDGVHDIIKCLGYSGETYTFDDKVYICAATEYDAFTYIKNYKRFVQETLSRYDTMYVLSKLPNLQFMERYNANIIRQHNGIYIVVTKYQWVTSYNKNGKCQENKAVYDMFAHENFLTALNNQDLYIRSLVYESDDAEDIIKAAYFLRLGDHEITVKDNCLLCSNLKNTPDSYEQAMDRFYTERNAWSIIEHTDLIPISANKTFIHSTLKKLFKTIIIDWFEYKTLGTQHNYVCIAKCGPATKRRVEYILQQLYESHKKSKLQSVDSEGVELFSQDTLAEFPAKDIGSVVCIDKQYYDARKLLKIITTEDNPLVPHTRQPFTDDDFDKVIHALFG